MQPVSPSPAMFDCNSLLYGQMGPLKFLVYVRITLNEETEEGVGPIPGILIDAARELEAEPHLVRVHMTQIETGTGFRYFGCEEFVEHVKSCGHAWMAQLVTPDQFAKYVRLLKGKISNLELDLKFDCREDREEVALKLFVDGVQPHSGTICPHALMHSTFQSDEHYIFTCSCGVPECSSINKGVLVVHYGRLVLWKAYYAEHDRLFLFDQRQYQSEILSKCNCGLLLMKKLNKPAMCKSKISLTSNR